MSPLTRWYKTSYRGGARFTWVQDPLYDADGKPVPFSSFFESTSPVYLRTRDTKPIGDCVRIIGSALIVSKSAYDVMSTFQCDQEIAQRSVHVVRNRKIDPELRYHWFYSQVDHDVLDKSLADFTTVRVTGAKPLFMISKWVLAQERIPDCDLFAGINCSWFCSERLRNAILEQRLTNFRFEEAEVSGQ